MSGDIYSIRDSNETLHPANVKGALSGNLWSELRVFLAVAYAGSFSKAAENLGISTPTVSRSVRRLQDILGVQLVVPGILGAALTSEGDALKISLYDIDLKIRDIETRYKRRIANLAGVVRLGMIEGIGGTFVTPELPNFHARFPSINIAIKLNDSLENIDKNLCDLALTFQYTKRPDLTLTRLGWVKLIAVASRAYIAKHGMPSRANLRSHHFISFTNFQKFDEGIDIVGKWRLAMADAKHVGEFESRITYNMAASSGLGIAYVGSYALVDKELVELDLIEPLQLPLYLAALTERLEARHIKVTAEWLIRLFSSKPQWFGEGDVAPWA